MTPFSLNALRERAREGNPELADETSSVISRDEFMALLDVAEASQVFVASWAAHDQLYVALMRFQ